MARSRREQRGHIDIWPGFVDALSTLLMVFIFVSVVFVLGQFFLNQLLEGKDTKLASLERTIAQLSEQLDMEEATTAELRLSVSRLSSDLQAARSAREDALAEAGAAGAERDRLRQQMFLLEDEKALLNQTLSEMRIEADRAGELEQELEAHHRRRVRPGPERLAGIDHDLHLRPRRRCLP